MLVKYADLYESGSLGPLRDKKHEAEPIHCFFNQKLRTVKLVDAREVVGKLRECHSSRGELIPTLVEKLIDELRS